MSTRTQPRNRDIAKPGHPTHFAEYIRSHPEVTLPANTPADAMVQIAARRRALEEIRYIPGASGVSSTNPFETKGIDNWWDEHYARTEIAARGYLVLPDDYTPGMTKGRALSGHRRTHRMLYKAPGVAVRMPSVASIRRFSRENDHDTFDVPVEAEYPGGTISGYVRVTRNSSKQWSVSGVNMPEPANSYVSETVQAALESRAPTVEMKEITNILRVRRDRIASAGVALHPTRHSEWIKGMGYNIMGNQMVIQLGNRTYGYRVTKEMYEAARDSWSPGRIYNQLVKGQPRFELDFHDKCGRYYDKALTHRCPSAHKERSRGLSKYARKVAKHVARV